MTIRLAVDCDFANIGDCAEILLSPDVKTVPEPPEPRIPFSRELAVLSAAIEGAAINEGWLTTANGKHFCSTHRVDYDPTT